jgi:peroxiredoxin Q/BCP
MNIASFFQSHRNIEFRYQSSLMPKLLLSLLLLSTAMFTQADVEVGDQAPAFTLAGSDGKSYTLADFKDKAYVVIAFFPKAFTGG